jgi:hypothetical protein
MKRLTGLAALTLAAAGIFAAVAMAAAPVNTSAPAISGSAVEGSTLTANDGSWSNSPTSFTYQWQRCALDGTTCGDIVAGTSKTYTVTSGDVRHTLRVIVTAANSDGKSSATSAPSDVVNSKNGPSNTVRPALSGTAVVGGSLRVTNGSWSPSATSYLRQWQRCTSEGTSCLNIPGATGQTYGVRTADAGHRLRALVTARTSSGQTTVASSTSAVVSGTSTTTTVVTTTTSTTTVAGNRAPSLGYISLRVRNGRAYARFRICDDQPGRITIIERDAKARVISVSRRWHVTLNGSCATYSHSWALARKFRTRGRYASTLRAADAQGRLSLLRSRSVRFR